MIIWSFFVVVVLEDCDDGMYCSVVCPVPWPSVGVICVCLVVVSVACCVGSGCCVLVVACCPPLCVLFLMHLC